MKMTELRCENVTLRYGAQETGAYAVRGISYTFRKGAFYSIIGKSGAGKTTLLQLLSGMLKPSSGRVLLGSRDLNSLDAHETAVTRRENFGFVFQDYQLLPELTAEENVLLPQLLGGGEADMAWCAKSLGCLGLDGLRDRYPDQLSGGEQQRCAIARAIANRPAFLFADEPTGNLDRKTRGDVLDFLLSVHQLYLPTIILVTHDLDVARSADILLRMEDGRLEVGGQEAGR